MSKPVCFMFPIDDSNLASILDKPLDKASSSDVAMRPNRWRQFSRKSSRSGRRIWPIALEMSIPYRSSAGIWMFGERCFLKIPMLFLFDLYDYFL